MCSPIPKRRLLITRLSELRQWAREGRDSEPVFIVGGARSGTSLLYKCLVQHGRFATNPPSYLDMVESNFVELLATHARPTQQAENDNYLWAFTRSAPAMERFAEWMDAIAPLRVVLLRLGRRFPVAPFTTWATRVPMQAYVRVGMEARGCERLVEKTPWHLRYTERLMGAFPRAGLVYLTRHPIDTISSYWGRARSAPDDTWLRISVEDFCDRWANEVTSALHWAQTLPDQFRLIRYEDFVADPEREFTELCHFLHEPPPTEFTFLHRIPWTEQPWDVPDAALTGPIVTTTKDWAELVSQDDARAVEGRLGSLMSKLGYEPRSASREA